MKVLVFFFPEDAYKMLHTLSVLHGVTPLKLTYEFHDKTHTIYSWR